MDSKNAFGRATARRTLRRLLTALALTATAAVVVPPAPAAQAIYGQVYIVAPTWWGFCPGKGNSVTQVVANNITTGDRAVSAPGKDTVFLRIDFERANKVVLAVSCKWNTPQGSTNTIRPKYHKQTFFFGYPSGYYTNG